MVKAIMSNSRTGVWLSSAHRGRELSRMACSMSPHGANTRSHHTPSIPFMTPYRIRMPRLDMPIS